jgi:hypothetical protein
MLSAPAFEWSGEKKKKTEKYVGLCKRQDFRVYVLHCSGFFLSHGNLKNVENCTVTKWYLMRCNYFATEKQ